MMRRAIFAVLVSSICFPLWAQENTGVITGTVRSGDNLPLPFANVLLYHQPDSTFVKGVVSDEAGRYSFTEVRNGAFYVTVTSVGYKKYYSGRINLSKTNQKATLDIVLEEEATQMKEVVVEAQRQLIKQEAGVTSVDIENSTLNAGQSVAEALKRVPGVTVDKDGKVSLKGKDGVMVMIDDKPLYMDAAQVGALLKAIPADQVKEIEVLTSPSAKYDAAGNGGMLNIKLKRGAYEGFNASATTSYGKGVYPKYNAGVNLSYKKKRLSLSGGYQYNYNKGLMRSLLDRRYRPEANDSSYFTSSDYGTPERTHNALFNGSYEIGKNGTLSWDGNIMRENGQWLGATDSWLYSSEGSIASHFKTKDDSDGGMHALNTGLGYKHKFDTLGSELSTGAEYKTSSSNSQQIFSTEYFDKDGQVTGQPFSYKSDIPIDLTQWSVKADFKTPDLFGVKMETGVKYNAIKTNSDIHSTLTGENHFVYTEGISAAYVLLDKTLGKWKINAGLRAEHTRNKGVQKSIDSVFYRSYTNLFPSGTLSYEASENTSYSLLYSKRIERPDYQELNPFAYYSDPYNIYAGNPYLLPQYTHHTEFTVSKWQGAFLATINYSYTLQPQASVMILNPANLTTTNTEANLTSAQNYGIAVSVNVPATPWWMMSNYVYVYNNRTKGDVGQGMLNLNRVTCLINATHTFTLPKSITGELSFMYESPHYYGTVLYREVWQLSAGLQKKFVREKLSVKISANDIFWKHVYVGKGIFGNTETRDSFKWDNRVLMVSLSYRFGRRISVGDDENAGEMQGRGRKR